MKLAETYHPHGQEHLKNTFIHFLHCSDLAKDYTYMYECMQFQSVN